MSFLPIASVAKVAGKVMKFVSNNDRIILTGLSVAGVLATVGTTAKSAVEVKEILDDIHEEEVRTGEEVENIEKFKAVAPKTAKAIAAAAFTIACIILAHKRNSEKIAALASAYTLLRGKYLDQQEENELLRQKMGNDSAEEVQKEARRRQIKRSIDERMVGDVSEEDEIIDTGSGDTLFWDEFSGKRFKASRNYVERAENHLQYRMNNSYYGYDPIPYLEWINQLGIRGVGGARWAEYVGWPANSQLNMELKDATVIDDKPYFVIHFRNVPIPLV